MWRGGGERGYLARLAGAHHKTAFIPVRELRKQSSVRTLGDGRGDIKVELSIRAFGFQEGPSQTCAALA